MRILQVVNIGFEAGGAEKSVRLISQGLAERGHTVTVVATDRLADGRTVFADHLVPAIDGGPLRRLFGYFWYRRGYRRMRQILAEFRPDIVHLHTIGEFSPSVLAATRGLPRLLTARGPEDWTLALLRWNLASASDGEGRLSPADRLRYLYLRFLQRPAYLPWLRRLDRVLALSQYMADAVRADVGQVPVFVAPNGGEEGFSPEPVTDPLSILFTGRLERVKGAEVLLDAFRRVLTVHPQARLTVIGEGSDRERLEQSVADLVADGRVSFRGWLGRDQVAECLRESAVVVVPSLWPEVFGRVALEALQTGRAVVASRTGGLSELVGPDNGVLVPPGDAVALAEALSGLLGDQELLQRLGKAAAERAEQYRLEAVLDEHERHYRAALASHRR
ncbi:glycosyltransferase family 4 protein [Streptacidiphilus fuscans]|uniref:D-inositol 3-phosphate glycosyltransferase n=1 Tax=Streptacidiphilus fuscans TaxID=2789292 RepID=A0A931B2W5_9ACTN|nr:glycosyltransferase family 4 protein [Streptacidiphilus fuscans]MBF9068287.1 glycosyltransferase family 4 protein [Streptacidiphilus fuscans]